MDASFPAVLAFALAVTFSPGPNNIMSTTLGMMYGYKRTLPFIGGVVVGFSLVMLAGAAAATVLMSVIPAIQPFVKYLGGAYILWLAWITWSHRQAFGVADDTGQTRAQGFLGGAALQLVNPKAMTYALVMYTTFLSDWAGVLPLAIGSAIVLGSVAFFATSTWALAGALIREWLDSDRRRAVAAGVLSAALVYTAAEVAEIPALIGSLVG